MLHQKIRKQGFCSSSLCVLLALLIAWTAVSPLRIAADEAPQSAVPSGAKSDIQSIPLNITSFSDNGMAAQIKTNYNGLADPVVLTEEKGSIRWRFLVAEEGVYQLKISYFPIISKNSSIVIGLRLDDEYPEKSAKEVTLKKLWKNEYDEKKYDTRGNEVLPKQVQAVDLISDSLKDTSDANNAPYSFHLTAGEHALTLEGIKDTMVIVALEFFLPQDPPTYSTYFTTVPDQACDPYYKDYIQAEDATYKTSSTMVPLNDRTSPLTRPNNPYNILYNAFGGSQWSSIGDYAVWNFKVPSDGLYEIAIKFKQNSSTTILPVRKIYIDDEIPFQEMESVEFGHDRDWQYVRLSVNGQAAGFWLTEGEHTLKIETAIGPFIAYIEEIEELVYRLNEYYRKIIMITGTSPDFYRDYQLDAKLPDVMTGLAQAGEQLTDIIGRLDAQQVGSGELVELSTLRDQVIDFAKKPASIQERLESFKINIGALSNWCMSMSRQSVEFDYFVICGSEAENDRAKANFFERLMMEFKAIVSSFLNDYDSIGDSDSDDKSITVWMASGRDQANTLKRLIDSDLKIKRNISVDLKLVQSASVLSALIAGKGPDVALEMVGSDPVNYATRNAIADLSGMEGFDEVRSWFYESALIPFSFNGGIYALPEKQSFPMLFYRTDILDQLGLQVPKTWDDVSVCLTELTNVNMEFGVLCSDSTSTLNTQAMFLFQNGGEFYLDGDTRSGLTTEVALNSFKQLTGLYTSYKLPYSFNALNRFRSGEMPMLISDYSLYNSLSVSAPEIRGLWGVAIVPGTLKEDGTVDHSVAGTVTGCTITRAAADVDAAWEFLKWWVSTNVQAEYGMQLESLLGQAARYPTANIKALEQLPWSANEMKQLLAQWKNVKAVPEVPGSYFTPRHLYNAFRRVITYGDDPRQTLIDYASYIDEEIKSKRDEFGLSKGGGKQ